ncbi:hypothetical protein ACO0QE_003680 [Hanseniaspora vineae]
MPREEAEMHGLFHDDKVRKMKQRARGSFKNFDKLNEIHIDLARLPLLNGNLENEDDLRKATTTESSVLGQTLLDDVVAHDREDAEQDTDSLKAHSVYAFRDQHSDDRHVYTLGGTLGEISSDMETASTVSNESEDRMVFEQEEEMQGEPMDIPGSHGVELQGFDSLGLDAPEALFPQRTETEQTDLLEDAGSDMGSPEVSYLAQLLQINKTRSKTPLDLQDLADQFANADYSRATVQFIEIVKEIIVEVMQKQFIARSVELFENFDEEVGVEDRVRRNRDKMSIKLDCKIFERFLELVVRDLDTLILLNEGDVS